MENAGLALEVRVHSKPVREYTHNQLTYIEARKGTEYVVRLRNDMPCRVLGIPSVDGLNTLSGAPTDIHTSGGYIIDANSHIDIPGWTLDNDSVAKFCFGDKKSSYVAQTNDGEASNCGVVSVVFFLEAQIKFLPDDPQDDYGVVAPSWPVDVPATRYAGAPKTTADPRVANILSDYCSLSDIRHDLGTEFGVRTKFKTQQDLNFIRATTKPYQCFEIHYTTREALKAAGVKFTKSAVINTPREFKGFTHCKPPKGWQG